MCVDIYINSISTVGAKPFSFFSDFFCSIASIDLSELSDVSILSGRSLSCLFMNMNIVIEYWILLFYPDKLCSQVVVRGNVSGHR